MIVADQIAEWLYEKGITHAFGIIGGGNVALWDAITRLGKTKIVCVHHEQAAAMSAIYYFRASSKIALCLVTTGAGSTNAITGVMAAWMDSVPLIVISGNDATNYLSQDLRVKGTQAYRSHEVVQTFTKWSNRAHKEVPIRAQLEMALRVALDGRQGPVWLDVPKDVQTCVA